jgi:glycosyltransferase involved in cell wall biosynthesis
MKKKLSVLTPCFNEEAGIRECYERVRSVMESYLSEYDYEHLFIDNCSSDATVEILRDIAQCDRRVRVIVNSRNYGQSRSPYHGMLQVTGDAYIGIVADLQTPPEVIPALVERWEQGYPMVIAVRTGMSEGWVIQLLRRTFYWLISRVSNIEQIPNFIGFGLFDRRIVEVLRELDDPTPYFRGMVAEIGFDKAFVEYIQPLRKHGRSRHSLFDLLDYAILGLVSNSQAPLRLMTMVGFVTSIASLIVTLIYSFMKFLFWSSLPLGMAPILVGMFFFASLQFLFLGILGEYVGSIHERVKRRPLVIEKERINFD